MDSLSRSSPKRGTTIRISSASMTPTSKSHSELWGDDGVYSLDTTHSYGYGRLMEKCRTYRSSSQGHYTRAACQWFTETMSTMVTVMVWNGSWTIVASEQSERILNLWILICHESLGTGRLGLRWTQSPVAKPNQLGTRRAASMTRTAIHKTHKAHQHFIIYLKWTPTSSL